MRTSGPDDGLARDLRAWGPLGILSFAVIALLGPVLEPLAGILVVLWVRASRTPWREIGYVRPSSWVRSMAAGIALGITLKLVMKAIVLPLLRVDPVNPAFHYLVGNTAALLSVALFIPIGAGFSEETVFRGFLFERLGTLLGRGPRATVAIVVLTTAWFAFVHYPVQGLPGVEQAVVTGLVFGSIFAVTGLIWTLMVAHTVFDLAAAAIIYWDLETAIAHLFFH